jgi:Mrp family chromosome partitioning ATPase
MSQEITVTIPENAMREEPLAFGLTLPQFAIAAGALVAAAVLFSFPIWLPLRIGIPLILCGPVVVAAVLPARGEVLYVWVGRFVRFARAPKVWTAELALANSAAPSSAIVPAPEPVSTEVEPAGLFREEYPQAFTNGTAAADPLTAAVPAITEDPAPPTAGPAPQPRRDHLVVVPPDQAAYASQSPVSGTRVISFVSFAGGSGKTTLACEIASLIAARATITNVSGTQSNVRVLLLDANRFAPAVGIRLGLTGSALVEASSPVRWAYPSVLEAYVRPTSWGVDVAVAPPHPSTAGIVDYGATKEDIEWDSHLAEEFLSAARRAGYQLVVVDHGPLLESANVDLLQKSDVVFGVVRAGIEAAPDTYRIARSMRAIGAGSALTLIGNGVVDDRFLHAIAQDTGLDIRLTLPQSDVFSMAADRGELAWRLDASLEATLMQLSTIAWPTLAPSGARAVAAKSGRGLIRKGR